MLFVTTAVSFQLTRGDVGNVIRLDKIFLIFFSKMVDNIFGTECN